MATKKVKKHVLKIKNLHVSTEGQKILDGVDLTIKSGEIHVMMGPNGSGKSTLCNAIMGHPHYKIENGSATFDDNNILTLSPDKRAHLGLFLGFQYPREITGVTFGNFMRIAVNTVNKTRDKKYEPIAPAKFYPIFQHQIESLKMNKKFVGRCLNEGFSGGEKKRAEVVQMSLLKPSFAMLDEIDSGLDIDGLKLVAEAIRKVHKEIGTGILLITHYARILKYLKPDFIHVMVSGKIVESGTARIATQIEKEGYKNFIAT